MANPDLRAVPEHLKGNKIYALGGIDAHNTPEVLRMGYYGVAVMGAIWEEPDLAVEKAAELVKIIKTKPVST